MGGCKMVSQGYQAGLSIVMHSLSQRLFPFLYYFTIHDHDTIFTATLYLQ